MDNIPFEIIFDIPSALLGIKYFEVRYHTFVTWLLTLSTSKPWRHILTTPLF